MPHSILQPAPESAVAEPDPRLDDLLALQRSGRFDLLARKVRSRLKTYPEEGALWLLAGAAEVGRGDVARARACFERVAELDRGNADALFNLGKISRHQGDLAAAVDWFLKAVKAEPGFYEGWQALGQCLRQQGRRDEAITALGEALRLAPGRADLCLELADLLQDSELFAQADAAFDLALQLDPGNMQGWLGKARVLLRLHRPEAALAVVDQALALSPWQVACLNLRAQCLRQIGAPEEAKSILRELLRNTPTYAQGFMNFAHLAPLSQEPDLLRLAEARLAQASPEQRVFLHFALARAREEQGHHEEAYRHLCHANALRKTQLGYDIARDEELFAVLKQVFSGPVVMDKAAQGNGPIFITGLPRSGTSLVETILSRHSAILPGGEMNHLARAVEASGGLATRFSADRLDQVARRYLSRLPTNGSATVTDKMPLNFRLIGVIAEALPMARIVHVRRDARATGWSLFRTYFSGAANGFAHDPEDIRRYMELYRDLMRFWQIRYPGRIIELDYEALVAAPEVEIRRLTESLSLPWEEACLRPQEADYHPSTASFDQVKQPIYEGSRDGWRSFAPFAGDWLSGLR